jgi:hypothetical protein
MASTIARSGGKIDKKPYSISKIPPIVYSAPKGNKAGEPLILKKNLLSGSILYKYYELNFSIVTIIPA